MNNYGHWNIELVGFFNPEDFFGFIYLIKNEITGRSYLGKKNFTFKKVRQKNCKKYSIRIESDWKEYLSSSELLKFDIQKYGKENFSFTILRLSSGKSELSFLEEQYQYMADVLCAKLETGEKAFYNKTIGHRHFAGVEKQSNQSKLKVSQSLKEYYKLHPKHLSDQTKLKISNTLKNHPEYLDGLKNYSVSQPKEEKIKNAKYANSFVTKEMRSKGGKVSGEKFYKEKIGIFALDSESRKLNSSNAGKIGGKMKWWKKDGKATRSMDCPGEGWINGRLESTSESIKNKLKGRNVRNEKRVAG